MADNKLLLKRDSDEDFLAEDDPLAELARLVGFDPAPAASATQPAQRREPVFDLEDELLKELEIYAQPAVSETAVAPAYVPVTAPEPSVTVPEPEVAPVVEAVALEPEPEIELEIEPELEVDVEPVRQPVILEAVETFSDASGEHIYERPASHPVFDLEDEILREFSAFDARRVTHAEEHPVVAEVIHQDPPAIETVPATGPVELHDVPDMRSTFAPAGNGRDIYESFRGDDLDAAISKAFAPETEETAASPVISEVVAGAAFAPEPVVRELGVPELGVPELDSHEPIAPELESVAASAPETIDDGHGIDLVADTATVTENAVEPVVADLSASSFANDIEERPAVPANIVEPSIEDFVEQDDELVSQDFADAIPMVAAAAAEPVAQIMAPVHNDVVSQPAQPQDHGLDELLAEVDKYPVVDNIVRWRVISKPVAAEDVGKAAAPVVQDFVAPSADASDATEPTIETVAAPAELKADAALDDGNFDIDLGEIEIDLSDLNEGDISASPDLLADIADEPVMMRDEPFILPPVRTVDTDYSSLPFDPSQITQEDETFESIAEMDVPEAPVVHEEEKPAPHPEYDIDLDAEMAQLFVAATAQSATSQSATSQSATSRSATSQRASQASDGPISLDGAAPRGPAGGLELDDFERALEEDFRRSFAENRAGANPDRVSLAPVYAEAQPARSRRNLVLLASAAVAIVLFGGAGVFAFMSGDTKILTSSEPKVILADTAPVKVVPEDPGGKQVPNQNKAVYDRVGGANADETKQESLLTSNEEPVDVVQRTLMPEALPMDEDTLAAATPTGDTIDPRLLPDEEEQDRVTTTNRVVSGVSPRKVKTMVVRPDGTLIEREVTEEDLKQQATNDAELMKIAQKAALDAATASDSQVDDVAKAIGNVPERLAPSDETALKPADAAQDTTARIENTKPVTASETTEAKAIEVPPVEPVTIEDEQPAIVEKPSDVAATAVETAEAKPDPVVTEAKPIEVAAETRPVDTVADQPVERSVTVDEAAANADAVAKVANVDVAEEETADAPVRKVKTSKITPVPEVRPVDQPVTVVGTVTDQGTVRSDTDAKPQEVALADPVEKPVETTALPAGSYVIQIASLPSQAEAQTSYSRLSAKFSGIIGGKGVDIRRAEIKNKGTYYRVRIPAGSKQEAQALCSQYKAAGGSCLVSK